MRKEVKFDEPPMTPDATDTDVIWSTLVCSVTLPPAVGVLPMVRPLSVMVTAVLAASAVPPAAMMMEVTLKACRVRVAPAVESTAKGVVLLVKKPDG